MPLTQRRTMRGRKPLTRALLKLSNDAHHISVRAKNLATRVEDTEIDAEALQAFMVGSEEELEQARQDVA